MLNLLRIWISTLRGNECDIKSIRVPFKDTKFTLMTNYDHSSQIGHVLVSASSLMNNKELVFVVYVIYHSKSPKFRLILHCRKWQILWRQWFNLIVKFFFPFVAHVLISTFHFINEILIKNVWSALHSWNFNFRSHGLVLSW